MAAACWWTRDVPTDRECFWRFFQEGILPALEEAMAGRIADGGGLPPAFWEEAAFDVRIPETDERLGIGEERVAPLEALHEDLYFVLLEHFRLFADTHRLPADSQFGRILPRVSTAAPAGRPAVVFNARPFTGASAPRQPAHQERAPGSRPSEWRPAAWCSRSRPASGPQTFAGRRAPAAWT